MNAIRRSWRRRILRHAVLALVVLLSVGDAPAKAADAAEVAPRSPGPSTGLGFRLRGAALHQFSAGLSGPGQFDVTRTVIEGAVRYALEPQTFAAFSVAYYWDDYDFSPPVRIAGQAPWSQVQTLRLSLPMFAEIRERWRLLSIPIVRLTAERPSDWGQGVTGGAIVGFSYQFGDRLRIGPGVGVLTELGDSPTIFPVVVIDWQITDALRLETGRGLGASEGPGLVATYTFRPWLKSSIGFRYERQRFRLETNPAATSQIGQDEGFPVLGGVVLGYPFAELSLFAGGRFGGKLRIDTAEGRKLSERSYGATPFVGGTFRVLF